MMETRGTIHGVMFSRLGLLLLHLAYVPELHLALDRRMEVQCASQLEQLSPFQYY